MWLHLAALWGCTLKEAASRCDANEWALWAALFKVDPWGEERADLRSAQIASVTANAFFRRKFTVDDFMISKPVKPKPTPQELFDKAQGIIGMFTHGDGRKSQRETQP